MYLFLYKTTTSNNSTLENDIKLIEKVTIEQEKIKPPLDSLIYKDTNYNMFQLGFKGLIAFRLYCILNIIGLMAVDIKYNMELNQYKPIRIIAYVCCIILFFHLF